ncbi:MASE1 domain-containing protein [Xanthomonas sp. NCPPB 3005]|uniref:MASE1 domain-containing protein n=1 Tax=Xanthomonas sp. NCPPB 3005 TaxID=3240913 RepID=UPI003516B760
MEHGIRRVGLAIAIAGVYYLAYRFAWFHSADQFFLPAGLRIASLLFLPYRYWPSIFIGDAAAMASLRVPFAEERDFPMIWAYGSSLLFSPALGLGVIALRRYWPAGFQDERRLPFGLLAAAVWGVVANISINFLLSGPIESPLASYFYKVSAGQYLTSLVAVLPVFLWLRRAEIRNPKRLARDSAICLTVLLGAYFSADMAEATWQRLVLLGLMLGPTLALTVLHGWRGAAIGVVATTLSLGLSIPSTGLPGNRDVVVFVVQQTLVVMGTFLLLVGATISRELDRSHRLSNTTQEQRLLARANHLYLEQSLRAQAESLAASQQRTNGWFRETVQKLKQEGHYELAMQINAQYVASTRMAYQQASDLYPFQIELRGLFTALRSPQFANRIGEAQATFNLRGSLEEHSLTLQLVTYRCICHAIEAWPAESYLVNVKTGNHRGSSWIAVTITTEAEAIRTKESRMAEVQLEAKMQAYAGTLKRSARKVSFLLVDEDQFLRRGTTIHDGLSLPFTTLTMKSSEL